jgi:uncharacterized metal-binding protein YceD (DUF177 family)
MDIDLSLLHTGAVESIDISGEYTLDKEYYQNTEIIELSPLNVTGVVTRKENEDFELEDYAICNISGEMIIPDSISLEEVSYPFQVEYDDFLEENHEKNENTLDIFAFLWENTVLEVPLQFTKVRDLSKFHGDGWRLISEDEYRYQSNPFSELLKDYDKE